MAWFLVGLSYLLYLYPQEYVIGILDSWLLSFISRLSGRFNFVFI